MNYPTTIYVGDTVTFTGVFDPVDVTPESVEWKLRFFTQTESPSGIPLVDSTVVMSGAGTSFSAMVNQATKEPLYTGASGQWYKVFAKAKCNDNYSNASTEFTVNPYVLSSINGSGGNNEGDTRTYVAVTDPPLAPVGMFSWSRTKTSAWGSDDMPGMTGMGTTVQKAEVDPGVWEILVQLDSGGYTSSATTSAQIDPATVSGLTHTGSFCIGGGNGTMQSHYTLTSSTGRVADLDHTIVGEEVTYKKNDGTAPNPFVADEPFAYPAGFVNPKVKEFGEIPSPHTAFMDNNGPVYRSANAIANGTTGSTQADQKFFAKYADGPTPANQDFFGGGGPFVMMRYIEMDANGNLQYRVTKHGLQCVGPPTLPLP